jgi:hypothetical protein
VFNINTTFNVILQIAPQTQQFISQSLDKLGAFLMLYTPADVQGVEDFKSQIDAFKSRLDQIDKHLTQKASNQ